MVVLSPGHTENEVVEEQPEKRQPESQTDKDQIELAGQTENEGAGQTESQTGKQQIQEQAETEEKEENQTEREVRKKVQPKRTQDIEQLEEWQINKLVSKITQPFQLGDTSLVTQSNPYDPIIQAFFPVSNR